MHFSTRALSLLCISVASVRADYLGPTYPAPTDLASNQSLVSTAWKNVTSTIDTYLNGPDTNLSSLAGLQNLTFSIGMFSMYDSAAKSLQFHHTSAEVANSSTGLTKVNGDSIYRIASLTKLFTALAGLISLRNEDWDRPITDFIPSLAEISRNASGEVDPVDNVQWDKVTLAALAGQISGIPRDLLPYSPSDYLLTEGADVPVIELGLPPLDLVELEASVPCVESVDALINCSANDYAMAAQGRPPMFLPWASPAYTDNGYALLGIAIANITGKSIHEVYQSTIFDPLHMTSSHSTVPPQSSWKDYVIPGNVTNAALTTAAAPDVLVPSGGIFSTTNDLAKFGTAILNSTLLPPTQTRQWMKPITHTALLEYSIGRPWEIYRYTHPASGIVTDIYTKLGDSGAYGSYLVLLPDFGAGFSIIAASSLGQRDVVTAQLADLLTETLLPALLAQAESESRTNYVGTYTSTIKGLNTTLTLAIPPNNASSKPGLTITSFIANATDVLAADTIGFSPIRLLPSIASNGSVAFRASPYSTPQKGLFLNQYYGNVDWLDGDSPTYGGLGVGLFVFEVDATGKAEAVRPAAWRVRLVRGG